MVGKRKLWATKFDYAGAPMHHHESKAGTYRSIERGVVSWQSGSIRVQHLTVYVDERDGQGWQVYERIDLGELAKAGES